MSLLLSRLSLLPLSCSSSSPLVPIASATLISSKIPQKSLNFHGIKIPTLTCSKRTIVVRASSEIDGKDNEGALSPLQDEKKATATVSVENLPLESKQKELMENKLRMKLAKKIRLRRKRLVQKRKLRKKGRWPPSKMKKLKNV